jgi:lipopolysaccharide biosynthesis glycosyltransferase
MEWIIATNDGNLDGEILSKLWRFGFIPTVMNIFEIGKDKWVDCWPDTQAHHFVNYQRLRFFLLPPGEYIWMDADLLCMRDARQLISWPSISACPDQPALPKNTNINMGLFRVDASEDLFDACVTYAKNHSEFVALADQSIVNRVLEQHPGILTRQNYRWNMSVKSKFRERKLGDLWKPDEAIFIHFMGKVHPWEGDEHWMLEKLNDIWREYYAKNC